MPPKKRISFGRKLPKAKFMKESREKLSLDRKIELKNATKEAVQKHRANLTEEKQFEVQQQDLEYRQKRR